jgi:hypothetical protein
LTREHGRTYQYKACAATAIKLRTALLVIVGGFVGLLVLIPPSEVPLALAIGWMGWWLRRSERPEIPAMA